MTLNLNLTWNDLEGQASRFGRQIRDALIAMDEAELRWDEYKATRSDSAIATAIGGGITEAQVTDVRLAYEAMGEVYDFANNVASPAQGDRLTPFRTMAITELDATQFKLVQRARVETLPALNAILAGKERFADWQSFRDGRNDATIATALSVTEAEITAARLSFVAQNEIFQFANDVASPTQGDRLADLRAVT